MPYRDEKDRRERRGITECVQSQGARSKKCDLSEGKQGVEVLAESRHREVTGRQGSAGMAAARVGRVCGDAHCQRQTAATRTGSAPRSRPVDQVSVET